MKGDYVSLIPDTRPRKKGAVDQSARRDQVPSPAKIISSVSDRDFITSQVAALSSSSETQVTRRSLCRAVEKTSIARTNNNREK
jgi:hypothetical protein